MQLLAVPEASRSLLELDLENSTHALRGFIAVDLTSDYPRLHMFRRVPRSPACEGQPLYSLGDGH